MRTETRRPLVALNLDSADRTTINALLREGRLPNLARFREQSLWGNIDTPMDYLADTINISYLTGCSPKTLKNWGALQYSPQHYTLEQKGTYAFDEFPAVYHYFKELKTVVFDLPYARPDPACKGIQVYGWGHHGAKDRRSSIPDELFAELFERFGEHPTHRDDDANMLVPDSIWTLSERVLAGLEHEKEVFDWLYAKDDWDVFMICFGGVHTAGHYCQPHPHWSTPENRDKALKFLIQIYEKLDETLGHVLAQIHPDVNVVIFSVESMQVNYDELPALVLLPELMYRIQFPGRIGIDFPRVNSINEQPWNEGGRWSAHIAGWLKRPNALSKALRKTLSPRNAVRCENLLGIQPLPFPPRAFKSLKYQVPKWYEPLWPWMEAYALPSFFESHVRINVAGREASGMVPPNRYQQKCDEISHALRQLIDLETGEPAVKAIRQTREDPMDDTGSTPPGDLLVTWSDKMSGRLYSPEYGYIGPACPPRSGIHLPDGFFMLRSPDLNPGNTISGTALDIAPTLLDLMGIEKPEHMEGKSLVPDW